MKNRSEFVFPATTKNALEFLRRGFPGLDVDVFDCHELEDGTIEEAGLVTKGDEKIASFALLCDTKETTMEAEIRLGEVGRYCGTVDEQQVFQRDR